ncbi:MULTISPECIES: 50S ribosomal protein L3 [Geobacter]|uniref:Large ribosomal subunit protein uL3 n=2 Tax=Geobacter TaxID=28231 RepID=A0A0C1U679_9BACT|nr:50S ribosomal protein L3 [Geobacter soli]ANA41105.1 50S ribosomal protein L3 [Geobacter anodireducens]KIE43225.1 50S ribosomal protein L3 [Geobacter soli]MBE2888249.1 50S ribosomal protein L3 [Geobacter anodireducens]HMN02879.1 50S ribosomal protein L3 [Geobacter anodireducens]
MMKGLIAKKLGMTQIFAEDGKRIPVTVVQAGPCVVLQKKTSATDGYDAIQVGFLSQEARKVTKPLLGHIKAAGQGAFAHIREFRLDDVDRYNVGDVIAADVFEVGEYIDVTGTSIGKGFQGVVKRWGFRGGRSSHGSCFHRAPGSIGSSAYPSRVFKNKKMPGQLGNERVTVQRLQVVRVDAADNILLIKGAIPGAKNGIVLVKDTVKPR